MIALIITCFIILIHYFRLYYFNTILNETIGRELMKWKISSGSKCIQLCYEIGLPESIDSEMAIWKIWDGEIILRERIVSGIFPIILYAGYCNTTISPANFCQMKQCLRRLSSSVHGECNTKIHLRATSWAELIARFVLCLKLSCGELTSCEIEAEKGRIYKLDELKKYIRNYYNDYRK